ncbi:non-ribosomal peptide synthetase, partial [Bacillus thuringiensis]
VLLFDIHHIISDGISTNLIIKEFIQLYKGELQPPLQIQYKDYAVWQQIEMQSERMRRQEAYWLNMFDGEIPTLELPIDYERPSVRSYEGDTVEFTIDKEISDGLKEIEKQTGATLYMVLLAAYTTLLAKYSGQEDIIVGTPIAGRTHADLEPIIGMFVNTLAIRNYPEGDKTFYMYVQEVKETMLNAYENQEYPFEELVQKVNIKRDMSRNPLFDTMLVLQNTEETELQIENLVFKPYIRDHIIAKFDLALYVSLDGEQLKCNFEFCKKIFKNKTIHRLSQDLLLLLSKVSNHPHIKLIDINLNQIDEESLGLGLMEFSF